MAGSRAIETVSMLGVATDGWPPNSTQLTVVVPQERVRTLESELVRTGVFDVREGCWKESRTVYDGMGSTLVLRRNGHVYTYAGSDLPEAVNRASVLLDALDADVNDARDKAKLTSDGGGAP